MAQNTMHSALSLWAVMKEFNINDILIETIASI